MILSVMRAASDMTLISASDLTSAQPAHHAARVDEAGVGQRCLQHVAATRREEVVVAVDADDLAAKAPRGQLRREELHRMVDRVVDQMVRPLDDVAFREEGRQADAGDDRRPGRSKAGPRPPG